MQFKLVAGAVALLTVVVAGIVVGEALRDSTENPPAAADATPAGDRPIPFDDSDDEAGDASDDAAGTPDEAEAAASPTEESASAATEESASPTAEPTPCVHEVPRGELVSLFAIGEVGGIGPNARYVAFSSCAGEELFTRLEQVRQPATPAAQVIEDGGCLYHQSFLGSVPALYLNAIRTGTAHEDLMGIEYTFEGPPDVFQAVFRPRHGEILSLSDDGDVHGTYTVGPPEGGRGGEQWVFSTDSRLAYEGAWRELPGRSDLLVSLVTATWQGAAIEDFSGEEGTGAITVTCGYAFFVGDD